LEAHGQRRYFAERTVSVSDVSEHYAASCGSAGISLCVVDRQAIETVPRILNRIIAVYCITH
jgi:hypothetical protein